MNGEGKRVLRVTPKKQAFDVMATREKTVEFRKPSFWIMSRLFKNGNRTTSSSLQRLNMGPSDLYYEQQLLQYLANQEACRDTDEEESED